MAKEGQPRISLCVIVKDEAERLRRMLDSTARWVDEIIVVDTGSTDETPKVAESFGARVYYHPWEHDFAKHRNQSISYATGDWILIMDADEVLDQETAPLMKPAAASAPEDVNCILFEMINELEGGVVSVVMHPRLFRNGVGFHYRGRVHNTPVYPGKAMPSRVRLFHYGYNLDPATMEAKHRRRLKMISEWIKAEPHSYLAHAYMAQTLVARPETRAECVEVALKALELGKAHKLPAVDLPRTYYPLICSLFYLGRYEEAERYAKECAQLVPFYPDPYYFLSWLYLKQERLEEACEAARKFVQLQDEAKEHPENFRFVENMTAGRVAEVAHRWVVAAARLGQSEQVYQAFDRVLKEDKDGQFVIFALQGLLGAELFSYARELAAKALEQRDDVARAKLVLKVAEAKLAEDQANEVRAEALEALAKGEHQRAADQLRKVVELSPLDEKAWSGLGMALGALGRREEAIACLIKGLNAHPGQPEAWAELARLLMDKGDYMSATLALGHYLTLRPEDAWAREQLAISRERIGGYPPTVLQSPPRLVVVLPEGMSTEVVRQAAPHLLVKRAWGEFVLEGQELAPPSLWATLYCGVGEDIHGLARAEITRDDPPHLGQTRVPSVWEILSRRWRVGVMSIPLGWPLPDVSGWAVAGYPAGLLEPALVNPPELATVLLEAGYRTAYTLTDFQDLTYPHNIDRSRPQEGRLYQEERNRLIAALRLPAVDVLVVGIRFLDYLQRCVPVYNPKIFDAYQQLYGWLELLVATLRPKGLVVASPYGYDRTRKPSEGGFYLVSWMRGEDMKARLSQLAPEILKFMGMDPSLLGRPRAEALQNAAGTHGAAATA